jgi:hypothetical protein
MPYLLLLIVVAVIGFVVSQQLLKPDELLVPTATPGETTQLVVPSQPQEIEQFGKDMNQFLQDSAQDKLQDIDKMTQQ